MKKKSFILIGFVVFVVLVVCLLLKTDNRASKEIVYNGNNLLISIDGEESSTLPTSGNYYLVSYDCDNSNTLVTWDRKNYSLDVSNGKNGGSVSCDLEFKSKPGLNEMPVGSYVSYVGKGGTVGSTSVRCKTNGSTSSTIDYAETEAPNSCSGQNAREDLDTSVYTYGYCSHPDFEYYTTGWRIAYIDSNNKPVIVSAGSPECITGENSAANATYIKTANSLAMKYCNSSLVDGSCSCLDSDSDGYCDCTDSDSDGLCDEIENGTVDAWAISDLDFYNITKAISGYGKRLTSSSSSLGDNGGMLGTTLYCYDKYSYEECGYNNDLIDNGGYYWFASRYSSSGTDGVYWIPNRRSLFSYSYYSTTSYGLRPVISLSSSVYVTGGSGTMDDPYTIEKGETVQNGTDSDDNVTLTFSVNEDFEDEEIDPNITIIDDTNPWFVSAGEFISSESTTPSVSAIEFTPTNDVTLSFDYGMYGNTWLFIQLLFGSDVLLLVDAYDGASGSVTDIPLTAGVTYTLSLLEEKQFDEEYGYAYIDNLKIE